MAIQSIKSAGFSRRTVDLRMDYTIERSITEGLEIIAGGSDSFIEDGEFLRYLTRELALTSIRIWNVDPVSYCFLVAEAFVENVKRGVSPAGTRVELDVLEETVTPCAGGFQIDTRYRIHSTTDSFEQVDTVQVQQKTKSLVLVRIVQKLSQLYWSGCHALQEDVLDFWPSAEVPFSLDLLRCS